MTNLLVINFSAVWGKVWPILVAVIFFGFLIFFHELGHFSFAKLFKVKVNEFAMGMGPSLFKFRKGETKYSLRLFPIGGYVLMEGEDTQSEDSRAFCNQKAWKRFVIVAAGGIINLIMGMALLGVMLGTSELIGTSQIHSFKEDAISCNSGLEKGDKIIKINNHRVFSADDISFLMVREDDGFVDFEVMRNGERVILNQVEFATEKLKHNGKEYLLLNQDFIIVGVEPTFLNVLKFIVPETISFSRQVYLSLFDLITGKCGMTDLSGPIGTVDVIADTAKEAASKMDWGFLLMIMALIAINIGLFNLLPLPALDGGRLLFILIEMIFRKPIPRKWEGFVHAAGMVALLALMAVISFSDIWKLIKG